MLAVVPGLALAHLWTVVPQCDNPYSNPYFFPGGLASDWFIHTSYPDGQGNCHWYTHTVTSATPVNHASWYLPVSTNYNHYYHVHTFIPCDAHSSAHSMKFRRFENGSGGGFVSLTRTIDGYCDSFLNADNHNYNGSPNGGYIQMDDNSGVGFWAPAGWLWYAQ